MTVDSARALEPYVGLFDQLLGGAVDPPAFADAFTRRYLADATAWDPPIFSVLDRLFASVDAYEEDDEVRPQVIDAIDATTLRAEVARARSALTGPVGVRP